MPSGPTPVFVTVAESVDERPTSTLPKLIDVIVADGLLACALTGAPAVLAYCALADKVPLTVPALVGANCSANEHAEPAASDAPHVEPEASVKPAGGVTTSELAA